MKLPRRQFLHLAAGAAALPATSRIANAQTYPSRPVHLIVGFAAGGAMDINARLMGQWLSERLGQQFVIENRTGAGGNIAAEAVVRASPDGYTLLTCATANAVNASLYERLDFNFIRDIAPVAGLVHLPLVLIVNPSVPTKTAAEFIAYAKANPGKTQLCVEWQRYFGTFGWRAVQDNDQRRHDPCTLSRWCTCVDCVARRAGASLLCRCIHGACGHQSWHLRPLAVTTATRWAALPDVPTLGETVPGYEASVWYGVGAPKNTPREIIDKLNKEINAGLADPKIKAQLSDLGGTPVCGITRRLRESSSPTKPRRGARWSVRPT